MASGNFFTDLFGRSPVEPLQKHIMVCKDCADQLIPFFQAVYKEDWEVAARTQHQIAALEHQADDLETALRLNLPKSLFLPVPRSDLVMLLAAQDKIANRAKDIAGLMLGRKMTLPELLQDHVFDYLKHSLLTIDQAVIAINELDELVESAFGGKEIDLIGKMINRLNELEHETDKIEVQIRAKLFGIEQSLAPVDVMFLYKIIEWVGDLADCAQQVGNRFLLLLAR